MLGPQPRLATESNVSSVCWSICHLHFLPQPPSSASCSLHGICSAHLLISLRMTFWELSFWGRQCREWQVEPWSVWRIPPPPWAPGVWHEGTRGPGLVKVTTHFLWLEKTELGCLCLAFF